MASIPVLTTTGDAYTRGFAHGRRFPREIADNLATYLACFAFCGLPREQAFPEADAWLNAITALAPAYAEEMRGIAEGAGQSQPVVALVNARYEIAFSLFGRLAMDPALLAADGCTTFALTAAVTADGHSWLGQNWDWLEGVHGRTFVLYAQRKDKPSFVCLTEAGIAGGKMGVNECGIGLVENGLASSRDGTYPYCKPFHVRCREVLDAESIEDAVAVISEGRRTCSANFLVGQAGGSLVDVESSPDHTSQLHPRDGIITHSNHFLTAGHGESLLERISPSTLYRAERMRERLAGARAPITFAHMRSAATDHYGMPNGICRHPDSTQPQPRRTMTVGAVLIDLDARVMHVANGPPCSNEYVPFAVS
jgi:isopenicillin-N N-acyltransferase-like protein